MGCTTVFEILASAKNRGFLGNPYDPCYSEIVNQANSILSFLSTNAVSSAELSSLLDIEESVVVIILNSLNYLGMVFCNGDLFTRKLSQL